MGGGVEKSAVFLPMFFFLEQPLEQKTSSPKGNDRSPENKQVFSNSSQVSKIFNWSRAANSAVHGWTKF